MSEAVVKPGYKKTEVGVIPEDWDLYSIEKICSRITDGEHITPRRAENGIFLLSARNIHNGYLLLDDVDFFLEPDYLKFKKRVNPESGDLLISCSGTIGRVCVVPDSLMFGLVRSVAIIKPIKEIIESNYLMFLFQFDTVQKQIQKSVNQLAQANLFQGQIRQLIIPCPLKKEQHAIAAALSDADGLIGALETLIEKKRAIKQAAMQQLLTGRTRLPGFAKSSGYKNTEVGVIPEDWEIKRFEDVITGFFSGQTPSRLKTEYYKGEIPWITSTELNYNIITDTNEKITESAVKSKNLKKLPKGTFLFAITGLEAEGTRGKCALTGIEATTNQSCMALFPNRGLITLYLFYYYEKFGDWYAFNYCQGTKQQSYTSKTAKKLPIAYPPSIPEQHAIATVLSDMDTEIAALEQRLEKTRQIKQGMMQQLLTGKVRLVTTEVAG